MTTGWSDRQQAMLREMGIHLWVPAPGSADEHPGTEIPATAPAQPAPAAAAPVASPQAERPQASPAPALTHLPAPAPARPAPAELQPINRMPTPATPQALRPTGVAAMDWPALEAAVAGCKACGLCGSRRQTVFGVGHRQARWMLIGEAPGEQEDLRGEPFVGKAGQLLDNMLRAVGLTRDAAESAEADRQVFIANVLKCRPPGNRNPEPQEVAQCEPFLQRQVELVQPRLIVAMGRFAVQSLLQTGEPIGRLRGRVHQYHGVPVVVTYHPAYLLRNPLDKARAWEDLCLAREVMAQQA